MNKLCLTICLVGATTVCLATINAIYQPLFANEIDAEIPAIKSLLPLFGTNSDDLLPEHQLAEVPLNLDKFCQNYPYNSRCIDRANPAVSEPAKKQESTVPKAQKPKTGWGIVPEVSTLGLGGSLIRTISPQLNARAGVNLFEFGGLDIEETDTIYEADLNLFNVSSVLDYYPIKRSNFRLSAGLVFSDNKVEGTTTPSNGNQIELGGESFSTDELGSVDAKVSITNNIAPYLGLGWGNPIKSQGLGFWFNLGVMFGGSPEVALTPNFTSAVPEQTRAEINEAIETEQDDIEDSISGINIYPVISLGFSYHF
jgi:hypothetical protein